MIGLLKRNGRLQKLLTAALVFCTILIAADFTSAEAVSQPANNMDGHQAQDILNEWIDLGYLNGDENGNYYPDAEMTRAEFIAIINRVMGYTEKSDSINTYTDITPDSWYYGDISAALTAGYISGTSDSTMSPEANITVEQAITVIARIKGIDPTVAPCDILFKTRDYRDISEWAKGYIAGALCEGYVTGSNGNINPTANITRVDAVVLLDRIRTGLHVYSLPGTYGSETEITQASNIIIASPGVTLINFNISGDIQIAENVGDGEAALSNVTVGGDIYINGGGENSVELTDVTVTGGIILQYPDNTVHIVFIGQFSSGEPVMITTGAIIDAEQLAEGADAQFIITSSFTGNSVEFLGEIDALTNNSDGANIALNGAVIGTFNLNASATVTGTGSIIIANIDEGAGNGTTLPFEPDWIEGGGAGDIEIAGESSSPGSIIGGGGDSGDVSGGTNGGNSFYPVTTGTITGTVTDGILPLMGAAVTVTVNGTDYSAQTSSEGNYSIYNVPAATDCTVTASKFAYTNGSSTATVTAGSTASDIDIALTAQSTTLAKVTAYDSSAGTLTCNGITLDYSGTDIAVGDYMNYTASGEAEKADVVTGIVSAKATSAPVKILIDGTNYIPSGEANASDLTTYDNTAFNNIMVGYTYTVYLDPFGGIIALDESKTFLTTTTTLLLLSAEENGGVYTATVCGSSVSGSFTLNASDPLTLQAFNACDNTPSTDTPILIRCDMVESVITVTEIAPAFTDSITTGTMLIGLNGTDPVNADATTLFYYYSTNDSALAIYIGIQNALTVDGTLSDAFYLSGSMGTASVVLVMTANPVNPAPYPVGTGYVYIDADTTPTVLPGEYTYSAYNLSGSLLNIKTETIITDLGGFYAYTEYSNGFYALVKCSTTTNGGNEFSGTLTDYDSENNQLYIGTEYCNITVDTFVFIKDSGIIYQVDSSALNSGDNIVAFVNSDNEAILIFITANT